MRVGWVMFEIISLVLNIILVSVVIFGATIWFRVGALTTVFL